MPYKEDMPDEMNRLVRRLLEQTRSKQIEWSTTDREDRFLFSSTRSSVIIGKTRQPMPGESVAGYKLWLLNGRGSPISAIESGQVWNDESGQFVATEQSEILEQLYYSARDSALEVENTLEDMFGALGIELGPNSE
jgi:hypothetical protein